MLADALHVLHSSGTPNRKPEQDRLREQRFEDLRRRQLTIHNMGLRESDLVEVDMQVNAANNRRIPLLGIVFLDRELNGKVSRQLVSVANEVHCIFLSQKACRDLCIVTEEFPKQVAKCTTVNDENKSGEKCTCPKREPPRAPPAPPCPATPENVVRLESYLKEVYASSALNRCERQPLPVQ